jgi:hypothetical protein
VISFERFEAPLSRPFPIEGKGDRIKNALTSAILLLAGERKLMNHFVVIFEIPKIFIGRIAAPPDQRLIDPSVLGPIWKICYRASPGRLSR